MYVSSSNFCSLSKFWSNCSKQITIYMSQLNEPGCFCLVDTLVHLHFWWSIALLVPCVYSSPHYIKSPFSLCACAPRKRVWPLLLLPIKWNDNTQHLPVLCQLSSSTFHIMWKKHSTQSLISILIKSWSINKLARLNAPPPYLSHNIKNCQLQ